jgi:hypothetical protein
MSGKSRRRRAPLRSKVSTRRTGSRTDHHGAAHDVNSGHELETPTATGRLAALIAASVRDGRTPFHLISEIVAACDRGCLALDDDLLPSVPRSKQSEISHAADKLISFATNLREAMPEFALPCPYDEEHACRRAAEADGPSRTAT